MDKGRGRINSMDFIYLLMNCVVTASIIVAIASAFWFILVLLTDSSDRHSNLYVITCTIGAVTHYVIWNSIAHRRVERLTTKELKL